MTPDSARLSGCKRLCEPGQRVLALVRYRTALTFAITQDAADLPISPTLYVTLAGLEPPQGRCFSTVVTLTSALATGAGRIEHDETQW